MRIRDALAALAWLRARPEVDAGQIVISGAGLGGVVALHAAAIDGGLAGVVILDGLSSFRSLLGAERYPWPADAFLPNVLRHYDLPELAATLACPVRIHHLRDGAGKPARGAELAAWRKLAHVTVLTGKTCVSGGRFRWCWLETRRGLAYGKQ
jgi:dienelactone hydrolase